LARYFSAASKERLESQPPLSALLGVEAVKAALISTAEEALRNAVARIGGIPLVGHEAAVFGVAFSPDGQLLATASTDNTVRLWSTSDHTTPPHVLRGHADEVLGVAFSPDGRLLATASADKTVRLWSTSNHTVPPQVLRGHQNLVLGVAFSPDEKLLATASADKTVRLWLVSDRTAPPQVLWDHESRVNRVAFSPDRKLLATASWDHMVRLWLVSDRTALPQLLRGHEDRVNSVAFSPDGKLLATASADKTVRLWPVVVDDLMRMACLLSGRNFSYEEWQLFLSDEPYRKTCRNRPLHSSFRKVVRERIKNGDIEGAVTQLQKALQEDGNLDTNLEKETRRLVASALVEIGQELTQEGEIKAAITAFAKAQAIDPNLEISSSAWNILCWFGSLGGFAIDVMAACERAVILEPQHGDIRDSRGVARTLTGDYQGAIEDFQRFVEWGQEHNITEERLRQRREWIRILKANQNPFTEELLKQLRNQ